MALALPQHRGFPHPSPGATRHYAALMAMTFLLEGDKLLELKLDARQAQGLISFKKMLQDLRDVHLIPSMDN
ncbi:hypothetical protein GUJ93_ZPchr0001g29982 [Zizania palustris]|uniref:Uncharacterized protein n=1 Tax=Zizania palustris TaxID=103762 RepID=A0A8J5V8N2_ZIZPA|nr:hypothetical protein GUJ93_ZPchr0001g29982 [Zizania palustris]